jgi:hypothetical protein
MFYYIDVHLLANYIQWIKMHGETVKFPMCRTVLDVVKQMWGVVAGAYIS